VRKTQDQPMIRFRKYGLVDFHPLKMLGKGSFGKVSTGTQMCS